MRSEAAPALYVISTPIGNLGDVTRRAVEVLGSVSLVLAEDTRRTGILLRHLDISAPLRSAHQHNEQSRVATVLTALREGGSVALVSDAGTPLLSDPGAALVRAIVEAGFRVVPIPGASALLAALVGSGIAAERFTFHGFPPRKGRERTALLDEVAASPYASVLYESPHRVVRLLTDLAAVAGAERRVCVARELTKLHEEFLRGTVAEVAAELGGRAQVLGEIVVIISGRPAVTGSEEGAVDAAAAETLAASLRAAGMPPSAVAKELRRQLRIPRDEAYALALRPGA